MKTQYKIILGLLAIFIGFVAYNTYDRATSPQYVPEKAIVENKNYERIVLSGGCFWCTESEYNHESGVISAISGYADSSKVNPTYAEVGSETVKARESVEVIYDPKIISIDKILEIYWKHINPTDGEGQFADRGYQYTPAIYYTTLEQNIVADAQKNKINESKKFTLPVKVEIIKFTNFYPAEEYHQDYKDKNPVRYATYREGSGRNKFIRENWEDTSYKVKEIFNQVTTTTKPIIKKSMTTSNWKTLTPEVKAEKLKALTPLQFNVTQKEGTERSFQNEYNANKEKGIYVDIVSGEPLFLSSDKYDSGTGWPSFVKPISDDMVVLKKEDGYFSSRVEVRSKIADSHLGHVFDDGPSDRGGKRYCMNSASMRFIPIADLEKEGYGDYITMIK